MNILFGDVPISKMGPALFKTTKLTITCFILYLLSGLFYSVMPEIYFLMQLAIITVLFSIFCVKIFKHKELDVSIVLVLALMLFTFGLDVNYYFKPAFL
ncbi:hypothetical protein [Bacteroides sp.]|uniref:hypothetical protein n=1 Tax=Bacteroides sp. TaxID=29523 RepID=UPI00258AA7DB|nr:hypothetical protein [Bacteroides sp.]